MPIFRPLASIVWEEEEVTNVKHSWPNPYTKFLNSSLALLGSENLLSWFQSGANRDGPWPNPSVLLACSRKAASLSLTLFFFTRPKKIFWSEKTRIKKNIFLEGSLNSESVPFVWKVYLSLKKQFSIYSFLDWEGHHWFIYSIHLPGLLSDQHNLKFPTLFLCLIFHHIFLTHARTPRKRF